MTYVDGFVLAVPTARKDDYRKLAERVAPVFRRHGATAVVECWGDDVPDGEITSFPMAVQRADDETVVFSWIAWPDKATRDAGNRRAIDALEAAGMDPKDNPFDSKRMILGGFRPLVEA
ncbi:MAG: DUF1428 domain-containing protein [Roseitalea sp.]|jgi:uncharacterized protein YbaA (DUF1428 family)|nr:DUF1428 domain-containing protein [Roseitalea sp.]MBO6720636.1 DUF1428 domain-containing protein [Roseitalea sp.]MBO6743783.1 DUF1428 domain-containing protein [Roseitalea sp.]